MVKTFNPCDECGYSYSKQNQESAMCKICEFNKILELEEQGKLLKFPCKVGDTLYVIGTCEEVENILDGTMYGANGEPGTATGYYCPYYLNENCPHEDCEDCEKCRNKLAVFEDEVEGFGVYDGYTMLYTKNTKYCADVENNFGRTVFLAKEEAEAELIKLQR